MTTNPSKVYTSPPTSTNLHVGNTLKAPSAICSEAATVIGLGNVEPLATMGEAFGGQAGHRDITTRDEISPKKRGQWYDCNP